MSRGKRAQGLSTWEELPFEELNRYAVVFADPPSCDQDKLFSHLIQSGFFIVSC